MRFWVREIAGWVLILVGMYFFVVCFSLLVNDRPGVVQSFPLAFIGFVVFRGGIHLLKVAMTARICLHAQAENRKQQEVGAVRKVVTPSPPAPR